MTVAGRDDTLSEAQVRTAAVSVKVPRCKRCGFTSSAGLMKPGVPCPGCGGAVVLAYPYRKTDGRVDIIRGALLLWLHGHPPGYGGVLYHTQVADALWSLDAALAAAEQDRDEAHREHLETHIRAEAASARADRLEQERDELLTWTQSHRAIQAEARAEDAKERLDVVIEALEEIAERVEVDNGEYTTMQPKDGATCRAIAQRALAASETGWASEEMRRIRAIADRNPDMFPATNYRRNEVWVLSYHQLAAPDRKVYFRLWTALGPCGTWDLAEAASFPSEQAAMQSPAFTFPLALFKPEQVAP